MILDGDGPWPKRIELTAAGDEWEFLPAATGRMVDLMPMPNPQIEGRWRRAGDTREPPAGSRGAKWHRVTAPRRSGIAALPANRVPDAV